MRGVSLAVALIVGLVSGPTSLAQDAVSAPSVALTSLFKEMWGDRLQHNPEWASTLGDPRYNDQVKDLSASAFNEDLARDRGYFMRLAAIDTTGLSDRDKQLAGLMQEELFEAEDGARFKGWEMPVSRFSDVEAEMAANVAKFPFASVKDYEDYIARLKKYPDELRQASGNMLAGMDEGRVQPADVLEKAAAHAEEIARQKPEESVFAEPLKRFPATVASAADRKRISAEMLAAIQDEVLPAYVRFVNFLRATEIPAATKGVGVVSAKDSDAYYAYCVKRAETWKKMADLTAK